MATQNRYYSNLGTAATLSNVGGINNNQTNLIVSSNTNWPTQFPFVLSIAPDTGSTEELVLATSGVGTSATPYIVQRGFDGTTAQTHPINAIVVPKMCELDFAEPQQHINSTTPGSVHGLPTSAWNGGQYQLVGAKQVLSTTQTSVVFGSSYFSTIPASCNNIIFYVDAKTSDVSVNDELLVIQYNGITSNTYGSNYVQTQGNPPSTASTLPEITWAQTWAVCGLCWGAAAGPNGVARNRIEIPFFADTTWAKGHFFQGYASDSATFTTQVTGGGGNSSLITALSMVTFLPQNTPTSQFVAGSLFEMYAY